MAVGRLKMRAGSANVIVNYRKDQENPLEMDTLLIKVDMGTFEAKNLHLSRSSNIIANVGFGKIQIDFGNAKVTKTEVKDTVGAGKLEIILPYENIPIRINANDSPLCQITMSQGFEKTTNQVFIALGFNENLINYIHFNIDVAVGNIIFKTSRD